MQKCSNHNTKVVQCVLRAVVLKSLQWRKAQADTSLVTEVGIVLVESAQVSVVWGRGAEEDGRRQVVAAVFEELVHLSGHSWLNGYPVA